MKKLGLDLGNRTLGIAVSDEMNMFARGVDTFRFEEKDFKKALEYTLELIKEYNVDVVALGFPKNMDGSIGEQAQITLDFKEEILKNIDIKIVMWDERLTSKMASNMMKSQNLKRKKRKNDIDKMAAAIILQGYLDSIR
jgi:putative Holliday junction resolvase